MPRWSPVRFTIARMWVGTVVCVLVVTAAPSAVADEQGIMHSLHGRGFQVPVIESAGDER